MAAANDEAAAAAGSFFYLAPFPVDLQSMTLTPGGLCARVKFLANWPSTVADWRQVLNTPHHAVPLPSAQRIFYGHCFSMAGQCAVMQQPSGKSCERS
ncbi:MAG: hypothetical protein J0M01_02255 [Dechloromonas sp.]|jgi:hypothetical protein|nr:hypothetical protein [Dechloromonas sp.]